MAENTMVQMCTAELKKIFSTVFPKTAGKIFLSFTPAPSYEITSIEIRIFLQTHHGFLFRRRNRNKRKRGENSKNPKRITILMVCQSAPSTKMTSLNIARKNAVTVGMTSSECSLAYVFSLYYWLAYLV